MLDQLPLLGLHLPFWLLAGLGIAFAVLAAIMQSRRKSLARGRISTSIGGRLLTPLPGDLRLFASLGEGGRVIDTLGTLTLRTTPGLRLVWLAVSILVIYVAQTTPGLWQFQHIGSDVLTDTTSKVSPSLLGLCISLAICGLSGIGVFGFELRMDQKTLYITRHFYQHRQYAWDDLTSIEDNGQYDYVLRFRSGQKAKVTKYLVGTPQLLKFIGNVLEQNEAMNAGTARS
jgi:hypothetical protein